jgi:putative lipoprotein
MSINFVRPMFLLVLMALFLVLCNSAAMAQVITGTASYRERIALPPGAVFEVTLEDITRADVAAEVIGRGRLDPAGQPPFRFEITYDQNRIKADHTYSVRARITHKDRLLFTSDRTYQVLTGGHGNSVDMLLRAVSANQPLPKSSTAQLQGTYWKLTRLNGAPVTVGLRQREAHIVLHSENQRLSGSGGCNRIAGGYELDGEQISFGKAAMTKMACPEGMQQEQEFANVLSQVRRWKITGQHLDLFDEVGKAVARFEAVYLRH